MTRRLNGARLVVATHNSGKMDEIAALLSPFGVDFVSAGALGLPIPEETEDSFAGNARLKAHAAARATGHPALADDSGLSVDALGGAPGVWTADWAETASGRDFGMAMERVWRELRDTGAKAPYNAQFRCTLAVAWPDGEDLVFEGVLPGQVVWPMRGVGGHGYDPIFLPDGLVKTVAELASVEKNRISHRALAFRAFVAACFT